MPKNDYADLVAQAEQAVKSVKDPELKKVAFEKVLDDLLGSKIEPRDKPSTMRGVKKLKQMPLTRKHHGPLGYVRELANESFFKKPKTIAQVKAELENRGHHIPLTSLSGPLQTLCQERVLRRQRVKTKGKKETFSYSDW
jgi:hypothetical protein